MTSRRRSPRRPASSRPTVAAFALDDLCVAFDLYREAVAADPSHEAPHGEAERLAHELHFEDALVATYRSIVRVVDDGPLVRAVTARVANLRPAS